MAIESDDKYATELARLLAEPAKIFSSWNKPTCLFFYVGFDTEDSQFGCPVEIVHSGMTAFNAALTKRVKTDCKNLANIGAIFGKVKGDWNQLKTEDRAKIIDALPMLAEIQRAAAKERKLVQPKTASRSIRR